MADTYLNSLAGGATFSEYAMQAKTAANNNTLIVFAALLFIVLSPGVILTLPAISATNGCAAEGDPAFKTGARDWFFSGQTNIVAVIVHALVFAGVLWLAARSGKLSALGSKVSRSDMSDM